MYIRIRQEQSGYYVFDRDSRAQKFIASEHKDLTDADIEEFVRHHFSIQEYSGYEMLPVRNNDLPLSAPLGMYMEISNVCNMSCPHCYKHDHKCNFVPTMRDWERLIEELHLMGVFEIRICGNEPTTSPLLGTIVQYAKDLDFYVGVNTNAFFGEKTQERLIAMEPHFIAVSLDGDRYIHDSIRKVGSYDKAVAFLHRLKSTRIKSRINMVVSRQTFNAIDHVALIADRVGADVSYLPFRPVGKNSDFNNESAIDKIIMRQVVEEIEVLRALHPNITLLTYFDVLGKSATYHHSMDFNSPCPARKNGFISYGGEYFPCDFLRFAGKTYFCGNVFLEGFEKIWRCSDSLKRFQNMEHDKCKKCKHYMKKCYGGCISGSISSQGSPDDQLCFVEV